MSGSEFNTGRKIDKLVNADGIASFFNELTKPTEDLYTSKTVPHRRSVQTAKLLKYFPETFIVNPLRSMSKVGGGIINAAKGKDPNISTNDIASGLVSGIIAGTPGGLPTGAVGAGVTSSEWGKAIGRGFGKVRAGFNPGVDLPIMWPEVSSVRELASLQHILPKKILDKINKVEVKKIIKSAFDKGAESKKVNAPIRAQNIRYRGMPESDVAFTPSSTRASGIHEPVHAGVNALKYETTPQGIRAGMIEKISEEQAKKVNKNIANGIWDANSREAYDASMGKLNEVHARAMTDDVNNVLQKAIDRFGVGKVKSGKLRISDKSWDDLSDYRAKQILANYAKTNRKEYKKAAKAVIRNYKGNKRLEKYLAKKKGTNKLSEREKIFNEWKNEGNVRKLYDTTNRFPDRVTSPAHATALGKQYSLKELNHIQTKEIKHSKELYRKAFAKGLNSKEGKALEKLAGESSIRGQGAREAIESVYVTGKKGVYGKTPFKPAEVKLWLSNKLSKKKVIQFPNKNPKNFEFGKEYNGKFIDPFIDEYQSSARIQSVKPGQIRTYTSTPVYVGSAIKKARKLKKGESISGIRKTGDLVFPGEHISITPKPSTIVLPDYWVEFKNKQGKWYRVMSFNSFEEAQKFMSRVKK